MRLIDIKTIKMVERYPPNVPPYVILSHRWGEEEITYQMFDDVKYHQRLGYRKVKRAADVAKKSTDVDYLWVDTCCINKMDGPELSESINSMYQWYCNAAVCIAYLSDVNHVVEGPDKGKKKATYIQSMKRSEWFERGWTLQELVAPRKLFFYDNEWACIGDKIEFVKAISEITKVPVRVIANKAAPTTYSLARRMSWAANRVTTRVEDIAYCLLGIFDVSMPLLYGEGTRAFRRLQEEIIKHSSDFTIFAWRMPRELVPQLQINGAPVDRTQSAIGTKTTAYREVSPAAYDRASSKTPRPASPATPPESRPTHSRSASDEQHVTQSQTTRSGTSSPRPSNEAAMSLPPSVRSRYIGRDSVSKVTPSNELGLFAESPKLFEENDSLHPFVDDFENFTITNRGLYISGSIYLRILPRPAIGGKGPGINRYLFLVGSQTESYIGILLIKIGPNLFQRDWDTDVAVLGAEDVTAMRGFLVTNWYIITDKPSTNTISSGTFRQQSIHVPSLEGDNRCIALKDTAPTHLWDVQDRLFVRPKSHEWTRYDMVLALKCHLKLSGGTGREQTSVNFVVMCNYRSKDGEPKFVMFLESDYPREAEMLMVRRVPNNSLMWADLHFMCPNLTQLPNYVVVNTGTAATKCVYRISVSSRKGKVQLAYSSQELYSVVFKIQYEKSAR